jgi:hypothetical protein
MNFRSMIRGKTRIALAWVFALILVLSARHAPQFPGIFVCFIGATLRFWASGYLRKDNRPAASGPYAMVRNPLYLGTWLMAVGVSWAIQNYWLLIIGSIAFAMVYHYIILDEEEKLQKIFGEPYFLYCKLVPRFFPRPWPVAKAKMLGVNPDEAAHHYDWQIAMKNKAYEPYLSFVGLIGFVWIASIAWQRFN